MVGADSEFQPLLKEFIYEENYRISIRVNGCNIGDAKLALEHTITRAGIPVDLTIGVQAPPRVQAPQKAPRWLPSFATSLHVGHFWPQ